MAFADISPNTRSNSSFARMANTGIASSALSLCVLFRQQGQNSRLFLFRNLQQGHVYMSNLKAGDSIYVYDADGRLAGQQTVSADGRVDVDLTTLTKGVYIVKTHATSIKIINK